MLLGYGSVQAIVDFALMPLATSQPELFTQTAPVVQAPLQGILLAGLWVGITSVQKGYRPSATRTLPSTESLVPLVTSWLGSSIALLFAFALLGQPLDAELEFVFGSATVVGGWRFLYSQMLPMI